MRLTSASAGVTPGGGGHKPALARQEAFSARV